MAPWLDYLTWSSKTRSGSTWRGPADVSRAENRPRGRRHRLDAETDILVVCGGRTEASYLAGCLHVSGSSVDMRVTHKAVDPVSLVRYAARLSGHQRNEFDEVWCVVDVDQFDITAAAHEAARRDIELAVSNPCFELWLLLHYEDCSAYLAGYAAVVQRLRRHVRTYDKANLDFGDFADGLPSAIKRARSLDPERNPSTGMWRLVERLVAQE